MAQRQIDMHNKKCVEMLFFWKQCSTPVCYFCCMTWFFKSKTFQSWQFAVIWLKIYLEFDNFLFVVVQVTIGIMEISFIETWHNTKKTTCWFLHQISSLRVSCCLDNLFCLAMPFIWCVGLQFLLLWYHINIGFVCFFFMRIASKSIVMINCMYWQQSGALVRIAIQGWQSNMLWYIAILQIIFYYIFEKCLNRITSPQLHMKKYSFYLCHLLKTLFLGHG